MSNLNLKGVWISKETLKNMKLELPEIPDIKDIRKVMINGDEKICNEIFNKF